MIQGYSDPQELINNLDDLENCFKNLWPKDSKSSFKKRKSLPLVKENQDADSPAPIDVLLDVLIGLLSKPSASLRTLVVQVFKSMACLLTENSLDVIFDVLKTREEVLKEEDEMEMEESNEEDSEEDSDFVSMSHLIQEQEEQEQGKDSDNEELLGDEEMIEFDSKLAEILKQKKDVKAARKGRIILIFIKFYNS